MPLSPADDRFAKALGQKLPEGTIFEAEPRYLEEPRGQWHGIARWVARPRTTQEVAEIVRSCTEARVGLVPYSGGTGLVGGQVAPAPYIPLLISLERMAKIRSVRAEEFTIVAEAGAILADVQATAADVGRLFPLSLASEGSARIGGLLSTNAGGLNVLRYGNARDLCLGIEAVLPDGQIMNGLKRLRKDNTGYDLRHLMIGAEGTLGVITAAVLKLAPQPARAGTAMMVVRSPKDALRLLSIARELVGDGINAFELIGGTGFRFLSEVLPEVRLPFADIPDWSVLIDLGMMSAQDPAEALEQIFAAALEMGLVKDGVIAQTQAQANAFWTVRERIPDANRMIGAISSHDISVPLGAIDEFIAKGRDMISAMGPFRLNCFGHLGDGNLHFNVFPEKGGNRKTYTDQRELIKRAVHDLVQTFDGSFSAEHGVGRLKVADLERYGDPTKLSAMRAIKTALDPAGIMNPGAVLRTAM